MIPVDEKRLQRAGALAQRIETVSGVHPRSRVLKALGCFLEGVFQHAPEAKLHGYVRCVEGFICPDRGQTEKRFKSRTELFLGPCHHDLVGELYEIRSAAEHLHDPLGAIGGSTPRDKTLLLFRRCFFAEQLARSCLLTVLEKDVLWPHFATDESSRKFWTLDSPVRLDLWGPPLNVESIESQFDERLVKGDAMDA